MMKERKILCVYVFVFLQGCILTGVLVYRSNGGEIGIGVGREGLIEEKIVGQSLCNPQYVIRTYRQEEEG